MSVFVQSEPFDPGKELSAFSRAVSGAGAIVTFTGVVRDEGGKLDHMMIEHYPAMTGPAIEAIEKEAINRWELQASLVIHRFGTLSPGDQIMMVATASRHRANAFAAAEYLMDYLKSRAPFWKKEFSADGAFWVTAKNEDEDALKRW